MYTAVIRNVLDTVGTICLDNCSFPLHIQDTLTSLIDIVFCPRTIPKQLALAIAIETGMVTLKQVSNGVQYLQSNISSHSRLIRQLKGKQGSATTQDEWMELAEQIDQIQGDDRWRTDPECPLYERERIAARIDEFVHLMRRNDAFELMFELRGGLGRNKFGLLHEGLFSKAMAGSKVFTETYHNVVCATLDFVCDHQPQPPHASLSPSQSPQHSYERQIQPHIPTDARLAFFNEVRHAYGRTALLLSGGAALGFYHCGVCKALLLNNVMPRVLGGSSAGSIIVAMIATRTNEEVLNEMLLAKGTSAPGHSGILKLDFFRPQNNNNDTYHDNGEHIRPPQELPPPSSIRGVYHNSAGGFHDVKRTWQVLMPIGLRNITSSIYDILVRGNRRPQDLMMNDTSHFHDCVKTNVGNFTFQEAFDRTGRILNITVTPTNRSDPPRLLNYLTSPHVLCWSAVVASAALPGVFKSSRLLVRDADGTERFECAAGQTFADGSMEQDLPMQQLSEMFNVNHFIISQANPHAVMFSSNQSQTKSVWTNPVTGMVGAVLLYLKNQLKSWLRNVVELIGTQRVSPLYANQRIFREQIITQEYVGRKSDISIIPWRGHRSLFSAFCHLIYNPNNSDFHEWINAAERETWKYIPAIKSHIAEEMTLDSCVQRLRKRLVVEIAESRRQAFATMQHNTATTATGNNHHKMAERLPSFFTSPSLVHFGGLGISDQTMIECSSSGLSNIHHHNQEYRMVHSELSLKSAAKNNRVPKRSSFASSGGGGGGGGEHKNHEIDMNSGWGGQGLRGNRSMNSLTNNNNSSSLHKVPSGLFIDEEEWGSSSGGGMTAQKPGEDTTAEGTGTAATATIATAVSSMPSLSGTSLTNLVEDTETTNFFNASSSRHSSYIKTTSMAQFYYQRNTKSIDGLDQV